MITRVNGDIDQLVEYVANNAGAWEFPEIERETSEARRNAISAWDLHIAILDTAILSLIGDNDIPDEGIEAALDKILNSSLWIRSLKRMEEADQRVLKDALISRSRMIWHQTTAPKRRGYFLAGIGLEAGLKLDAIASVVNPLLIQANFAIRSGEKNAAVSAITFLADQIFTFFPFKPESKPENWREILRCWLFGDPITIVAAGRTSEALQFIERELVYRLSWAMEAIRVRAIANGDDIGESDFSFEDHELDLAVAAVETGTLIPSASILIQAGFSSRIAAIKAVTDTDADFETGPKLQEWLQSKSVEVMSARPDWPTEDSKAMWTEFTANFSTSKNRTWKNQKYVERVKWFDQSKSPDSTPLHIHHWNDRPYILSADGAPIGILLTELNPDRVGLLRAEIGKDTKQISMTYFGPDDLFSS